jgi:hypothetical protein
MKTILITAFAALVVFAGAPALAQSAPTAAAPTAPAPGLSVQTTKIGVLMANPAAKAVLEKELPMIDNYMDQIRDMTLVEVAPKSSGIITEAKLKAIQTQFDAIKP